MKLRLRLRRSCAVSLWFVLLPNRPWRLRPGSCAMASRPLLSILPRILLRSDRAARSLLGRPGGDVGPVGGLDEGVLVAAEVGEDELEGQGKAVGLAGGGQGGADDLLLLLLLVAEGEVQAGRELAGRRHRAPRGGVEAGPVAQGLRHRPGAALRVARRHRGVHHHPVRGHEHARRRGRVSSAGRREAVREELDRDVDQVRVHARARDSQAVVRDVPQPPDYRVPERAVLALAREAAGRRGEVGFVVGGHDDDGDACRSSGE
ncbi:hypothetical protein F4780DRAFT_116462 [Xylariomycetidae sp. FL0641]|nr:hypothetical protein F4780DRAFT_116462 [Xylariomycetidae sp. FL0641]